MVRILLVCAQGMSTSIIANKMKASLHPDENDWIIEAKEATDFQEVVKNYDIVLLGPQIRFKKDEFSKIAEAYNVPVMVIDSVDYGLCRGDAILKAAKEKLKSTKVAGE
jgi:PTS system cellobiose-specific IIB component